MADWIRIEFDWQSVGHVSVDGGKLRFPVVDDGAGIYRFDLRPPDQPQSTYIGEADRLRRRFQHYRTPGPTQATNLRINERMLQLLAVGGTVDIAICTSASIEVESEMFPADLACRMFRVALEHLAQILVLKADGVLENR